MTYRIQLYDAFKSFRVVDETKDEYLYGSECADVERIDGPIYAVLVDHDTYDSENRSKDSTFLDAFSDLDKAEKLAIAVNDSLRKAFLTGRGDGLSHKDRAKYGVEYVMDSGKVVTCGLSQFLGWGVSFNNVAIVTAHRHSHPDIEYR
jgi:hypothetical protein